MVPNREGCIRQKAKIEGLLRVGVTEDVRSAKKLNVLLSKIILEGDDISLVTFLKLYFLQSWKSKDKKEGKGRTMSTFLLKVG